MASPPPSPFSPNEYTILSSWFEGTDCDEDCDRPEVAKALDERGYDEPVGFIYTRHQAAVAGIVLDLFQHRLVFESDPRRIVSEALRRRRQRSDRDLDDSGATIRHLFTIWWSGGPGNAWADIYNLVWLPGFARFVVIDSADDEASYEHTDFAIGHFRPTADANAAAMAAIARVWRLRREVSVDSAARVIELQPGTIAGHVVRQWLGAVWKVGDRYGADDDDAGEPFDGFAGRDESDPIRDGGDDDGAARPDPP
jgi:hypothetical protein